MNKQMSRRTFIKGASLVIAAAATPAGIELFNASRGLAAQGDSCKLHAFLEIAQDETVTFWVGQTELGQGTHTGISMILADEIEADWNQVRVKQALAGEPFKDPVFHMQITGGSTSIRHRWDLLRKVGAAAREMLIKAAADEWKAQPADCHAQSGKVVHKDGRSLSFGKLCSKAAALPAPQNPTPKAAKDYKIIGSKKARMDIPAKVAGAAVFGMDFKAPGMWIASLVRPPQYGAKPESFDEDAAMRVPGVTKVVNLGDRVAVCAENTYAALQGRDALDVQWSGGSHPELDDDMLDEIYQEHLGRPGAMAEQKGDAQAAMDQADKTIESIYQFPYLAHATVEPMNCTAQVEKERCRIWVPTQGQTVAQMVGSKISGLPNDKVEVMTTYCGGGFGRRAEAAVVADAVLLSKMAGRPVKAVWTREDDFKNDFYRPASISHIKAGLDPGGKPIAWMHKIAMPSIMSRVFPDFVKNGIDPTSVEGAADFDYQVPNKQVEYVLMDLPIPVGFWRSVGNTIHPFVVESMMDDLADAADQDPVEFRLSLLEKGSRAYRTLELLADKSGWSKMKNPGASPRVSKRNIRQALKPAVLRAPKYRKASHREEQALRAFYGLPSLPACDVAISTPQRPSSQRAPVGNGVLLGKWIATACS
jgi:isoquinoline 1-oxidoreductase beta subunit